MEDGTLNSLGATRAANAAAAEAAADAVTGATLHRRNFAAEAPTSAPIGSWVEVIGGRQYWIGPGAFFQVNTQAAESLLREALAHLPDKLGTVVDAHAGVGTFALALAERSGRVHAFETSTSAIASGRWTAQVHGIKNVTFTHGKAEQLLARVPFAEKLDAIVLDPPRAGCHPDLLAEIVRRRITLVVYVSCDPSTLARDIKALSPAYTLESARVVDMFPQTFHIETVCMLRRET
jgi:23S rRNA (uracil1939-C5)-methyltransferase